MFLCEKCIKKRGYFAIPTSYGNCEMCGGEKPCADIKAVVDDGILVQKSLPCDHRFVHFDVANKVVICATCNKELNEYLIEASDNFFSITGPNVVGKMKGICNAT